MSKSGPILYWKTNKKVIFIHVLKFINIQSIFFYHNECSTFLLPWEFFTILKTSKFLSTYCCKLWKLECYFLLFGFNFLSYWCALRSNFPIDLVELWAAVNWPLTSPLTYLNFSILCFLLASILSFLVIFLVLFSFWVSWCWSIF